MSSNRLLVVDDDENMGEIIVELGRQLGYEAMHISDPADLKQLLGDWSPTVIVTDLQMPNFDGVAFLRLLAAESCRAKIVIVSGMDQKLIEMAGHLSQQRGLEICGTFTKPFSNVQLSACLGKLMVRGAIKTTDVAHALRNDEMKVYLQPKCDLISGLPNGAEALVRWVCPIRGVTQPSEFLHLVEGAGFADALLDHVLTATLHAASQFRIKGLIADTFHVSVNMMAENLLNLSLPDRVRAICETHDWPTQRLTLELTETASMDDSLDVIDVLTRLRLMNFNLSIDDFGTGYSSLLRLRQLPFTEIKIDRSFTSQILGSRDSAVIVRTILTMAESLGLEPIAEGVENQAIGRELVAMGCGVGQGYHYSRPLPVDEFGNWLAM